MHLNRLLAPQSSKHFAGNCLINPVHFAELKKKNVKKKSFPQKSPASQREHRKGEKQKISDVLHLSDPTQCQPTEVWRDDWNLFAGQFVKSYSEANIKQQVMQPLDAIYLWNTICEHNKTRYGFSSVLRVLGSKS